jgi:hypothetical protein
MECSTLVKDGAMSVRDRLMRLVSTQGTLSGWGYLKRILIAFALCFVILLIGMALTLGAFWISIELDAPHSVSLLTGYVSVPFAIAGAVVWWAIAICSAAPFLRYVAVTDYKPGEFINWVLGQRIRRLLQVLASKIVR